MFLFPLFQTPPIQLHVDASQCSRLQLNITEKIPCSGGPMVIHYPKWIPGEHQPSGPINDVVRFHAYANGKEIEWKREQIELFNLKLDVPTGAKEVELRFTVASQPNENLGAKMGRIKWNRVMFLPDGRIDQIMVSPSIAPPKGWTIFTALKPIRQDGTTFYDTVDSEELVDSPAELGQNARTFDIGNHHYVDVLTTDPTLTNLKPEILTAFKNLTVQANLLTGSPHYRQYRFLTTFGEASGDGLEHHECSEDGDSEKLLTDPYGKVPLGALVCHEMFHSWCGKHRRPSGLITRDFTEPEETGLLWVYEGLTEYYGEVLTARAGFATVEQERDRFVSSMNEMATRTGRNWRPNGDTAAAASILRSGKAWSTDRRQQDYYSESQMIWLEADVLIRKATNGAKSLDDFAKTFLGGPGGRPTTIGYARKDVIEALESVLHYDWAGFLHDRVDKVRPNFVGVFESAGWRPYFDDKPNMGRHFYAEIDGAFAWYIDSIGFLLDKDGTIVDIAMGSEADKAGMVPGEKLAAVNGRVFTNDVLTEELKKSPTNRRPIEFLVQREKVLVSHSVGCHGGLHEPHLQAIPGGHDYLADIFAPRKN